jgi:hypothetical protein
VKSVGKVLEKVKGTHALSPDFYVDMVCVISCLLSFLLLLLGDDSYCCQSSVVEKTFRVQQSVQAD